jgi:hypothetical protein
VAEAQAEDIKLLEATAAQLIQVVAVAELGAALANYVG